MNEAQVEEAALILLGARRTGRTVGSLPDGIKPLTFADGYRIQDRLLELDGRPIGLVKIGCTTVETQRIMNLDEPIAGCLAADAIHRSGTILEIGTFHHHPLIECEFAMRLAVDLDPDRPVDSMAAAVALADAVAPALELVDGRYHDQLGIDGPRVVADNSMATAVVLGSPIALDDGYDPDRLAETTVRLVVDADADIEAGARDAANDDVVTEGRGSNVLGDPWRSFQWALRHLADRSRSVPAGTWIITGSCSGAPPAPLDSRLTARFAGLGDVSVTIADRLSRYMKN